MTTISNTIIGAVIGDVIGSAYEFNNIKSVDFKMFTKSTEFTDDSVLTIAVADCLINNKDFARNIKHFARKYPNRGYGGRFADWIEQASYEPYNSFGNGSAMRVSPVGFAFDTMEKTLEFAKKSAEVTHNHPEGIKGAQAVAAAIFLARTGKSKQEIKDFITSKYYKLDFTLDEIRDTYGFYETCQESVPQAIQAFLESENFENSIRLAISIGGDSDTIACITGGIASAFYKEIPFDIIEKTLQLLPNEFIDIIEKFDNKFGLY